MKLRKNTMTTTRQVMSRLFFAAFAAALSTTAFATNTWYVAKEDANAANTLDEGRGSEALPFRTIQAALDNPDFEAGDIVLVKRGDYDEGGVKPSGSNQRTNRVYVTKTAFLKAVEGQDVTRIVGTWGTTYPSYGGGTDGIRCVQVATAAAGTVIEGFTFVDGSAIAKWEGGAYANRDYSYGGGFFATGGMKNAYVVDCTFLNCTAYHGGAAYGGTLIRCRLDSCSAAIAGTTFYKTYAFACMAVGCTQTYSTTRYALGTGSVAVNCTFIDNTCYSCAEGAGVAYNCIFAGNTSQKTYPETGLTNCVIDASSTSMAYATGCDDFRLIEGSSAIGAGAPEWRQILVDLGVPSSYLESDFAGETIDWAATTVNAGAMMGESSVADQPATSRVKFSGDVYVDGKLVRAGRFIRSATFPTNYEIRPADSSRTFCCYVRTAEGSSVRLIRPHRIWPGTNGTMRIVLPLKTSLAEMTYTPYYAAKEIWTDPVGGSDETGDGSETNAYETIQYALNMVSNDFTVIRAKRGDYRKGGMATHGLMSRVNFNASSSKHILVRAEEGPAVTTIWGAADPETANNEIEPGCGTNAVRCVCVVQARFSAIQGFTLRDGHTFATADEADEDGYARDGAAVGTTGDSYWNPPPVVLDCVITNCVSAGSIFRTAYTKRCLVVGNKASGKIFYHGFQAANLVLNNQCSGIFQGDSANYHGRAWMVTASGNTLVPWGTSFDNWTSAAEVYGCILKGDDSTVINIGSKANSITADPLFAGANDYRPAVGGPAVDAIAATDISLFCYYLGSDFYGNPLRISPDGNLTAGAVQGPVLPCKVSVAKSSDDVSLLVDGVAETVTRVVEPGTVINMTLAADVTAARYAKGYLLNGEEHLFESYPGSASLQMVVDGALDIRPIVSTEWHVDAENGNDETGNGFTAGTAKKTLAEAFTNCAVVAGDTVYAHPGTYKDGEMRTSATAPHASRVIVPANVTLKATGSAEETIILGAASDSEFANGYGMGTNAVRCAALGANALIEGFTLTGGRTLPTSSLSGDNAYKDFNAGGAGVAGVDRNTSALVRNCVISNNFGMFGGGGMSCRYQKCKVLNNTATASGGAIYRSGIVRDCFVDNNHGTYIIQYSEPIYNCTIGYNNKGFGTYYYQPAAESYRVFNSIVYRPGNNQSIYWNCALGKDWTKVSDANLLHGTISTNVAALKLDENLKPTKDSLVVDAGDDEKRGTLFPETDLDGVPRVLNGGRFDIGAYEYDWRKDYSKTLGKRVEVTDVTSNVVEVADSVRVPEGTLSLEWQVRTGSNPTFNASVTGEGVLSIVLDGEPFASLNSDDGAQTFTLPADVGTRVLDFQYSGDGHAELSDFSRNAGSVMFLR